MNTDFSHELQCDLLVTWMILVCVSESSGSFIEEWFLETKAWH